MSVKIRVQRLEDSRKTTDEVYEVRMERTRQAKQWIEDMTKSIQQGTPMPQYPESDMPESPEQRKANASARAWIDEQVKPRLEHEHKKPIA